MRESPHGVAKLLYLETLGGNEHEQRVTGFNLSDQVVGLASQFRVVGQGGDTIHTVPFEARHLVLHESNDGIDHERSSRQAEASELVDEALAGAGGQKDHAVPPESTSVSASSCPWRKASFAKTPRRTWGQSPLEIVGVGRQRWRCDRPFRFQVKGKIDRSRYCCTADDDSRCRAVGWQ